MANLDTLVNDISGLTLLETSELVKLLETKLGVSAAAPVAAAAAPAAGGRRGGSGGRSEDRVRRHPQGSRREQDRRHQGSPRGGRRPRPGGSQGPGRRRPEDRPRRRDQGRSRRDQEEARSGWRQGRDQVSRDSFKGAPVAVRRRASSLKESETVPGQSHIAQIDQQGKADIPWQRLTASRSSFTAQTTPSARPAPPDSGSISAGWPKPSKRPT